MNIGTIEKLSMDLMNAKIETLRPATPASAEAPAAEPTREAVGAVSLGMDFSGLEKAHTLDADRVAALIADPFGEE